MTEIRINRISFVCPNTNKMISAPGGALTLITYYAAPGGYMVTKCTCGEEHPVKTGASRDG